MEKIQAYLDEIKAEINKKFSLGEIYLSEELEKHCTRLENILSKNKYLPICEEDKELILEVNSFGEDRLREELRNLQFLLRLTNQASYLHDLYTNPNKTSLRDDLNEALRIARFNLQNYVGNSGK
jgi:hypothetical protein